MPCVFMIWSAVLGRVKSCGEESEFVSSLKRIRESELGEVGEQEPERKKWWLGWEGRAVRERVATDCRDRDVLEVENITELSN